MAQLLPLTKAAEAVGISRVTLGRWIRAKKIKATSRAIPGSNLSERLVDLDDVRALVGDGIKAGRPASPKRSKSSKR